MRVVSELAEALRDAIVEYQVRADLAAPHRPVEFFTDTADSSHNKGQYMSRIVD
jgi:hypothetical protein